MSTFAAYLKKEHMESSRQSKYLVLGAFFGFFALSTPIMLRLMPSIIESQMPSFPKELMEFDAVYSVQNYIRNIYQLGNMAVAFVLIHTGRQVPICQQSFFHVVVQNSRTDLKQSILRCPLHMHSAMHLALRLLLRQTVCNC